MTSLDAIHFKPVTINKEIVPARAMGTVLNSPSETIHPDIMDNYHESLRLIYLDPPFCTGRAFETSLGKLAYNDKNKPEAAVQVMQRVLTNAYELLADDGSLYLHVDHRLSHYMRILLDYIFGSDKFINEIIWAYNSGGRSKYHFSRKHDVILLYGKTKHPFFNILPLGVPRGANRRNNMKRGSDESGRAYYSIISAGKEYKYYEDDLLYPTDVWTDIPHLHQRNPERVDYPTQKPEALIERIMLASSEPGDIVGDLFSGSGTLASVALKHKRRFLVCDSSSLAVACARKRLLSIPDILLDGSTFNPHNIITFEYGPPSGDVTVRGTARVKKREGKILVNFDRAVSQVVLGYIYNDTFIHMDSRFLSPTVREVMFSVKNLFGDMALQIFDEEGLRTVVRFTDYSGKILHDKQKFSL